MNNRSLYIIALVGFLLFSCSVERKNPLSKAYHNTTARYNGYFLAKEKMRTIEESIQQQMVYDYNQVLPIYPTIDSATYKAFNTDLEDVIKKASFPVQYHKNSKWIDDSYILIGKARYYQLSFAEAASTFKYVNATSKDPHARHEALVWLMRCFLMNEEPENAQAVSEVLRKERLNKVNARELYLARAHYHKMLGDTAALIHNLALSVPNFDEKDQQSQVRFSLARLYQLTDQNKDAYKQYNKILRRNPPYDLSFFSRLYIGQVSELTDRNDKERIAGYFKKLLKDSKNTEYRDKIYYEMAVFELRQQNYDKALALIQQSLDATGSLANQKAYTYLLAGQIHFEHLNKYDMAQAYYDSAVQVYPQHAPEYEAVVERKNVLTDFATQYNTIHTQDSLQRIARMPEAEREDFIKQLIQREEELRMETEAKQQQLAQQQQRQSGIRQNNTDAFAVNNSPGGVWYFDNPAAMATARSEFNRRWGDRPLQDNWRTRTRSETNTEVQVAQQETVPTAEPAISAEERVEAQLQTYLANLPISTAEMLKSERMVEEALFDLGNIYNYKLQEPVRAIETYEKMLQRFPKSQHVPEVYYSLYLIYDKAGDERKSTYYSKIKQEFPNTTYAMLVDDPAFMTKNAADNLKAHTLYDSAFTYYEHQNYEEAKASVAKLIRDYPLNDITDKAEFLSIMITARTEKPEALREQLKRFKAIYPGSPLQEKANQLLTTYASLEQQNMLRKDAPPAPEKPLPGQLTASLSQTIKSSTEIVPAKPKEKVTPVQQTMPDAEQTQPQLQAPAQQAAAQDTVGRQKVVYAKPEQDVNLNLSEPKKADAPVAKPANTKALAYEAAPDSAYYFVAVFPAGSRGLKDIEKQYAQYQRNFWNHALSFKTVPVSDNQMMLVGQTFTDPVLAQTYHKKQSSPPSPLAKFGGVQFTTFVITSANYQKLLQKQDIEEYLTFYQNNY
ncbi:tetratricopeptide repeat protein [Pontibacter harenae]|uniref:type IX secretion system periplasmic lipoprotein PorW/SprE n=1 Tax=Pontibacter harenae TaxID=2894083 RepID=UPI001E5A4EB5|nr:tetratricopeptide repeat protein [Pontibacter harenae]MCC9168451.1 tetratricopeptide repeat protein [Pontibacter harenae]